ncbi:MAG: hypothetical protein RLP02_14840, partial [Coleofasciculus sp. C2-GNP5-27]
LSGYTCRSVISVMDRYSKNNKRLREIEQKQNIKIYSIADVPEIFSSLLPDLAKIAHSNGMEILFI